jgi:hypothetical protein
MSVFGSDIAGVLARARDAMDARAEGSREAI